jgi:hypothetical protein
MILATGPVVLLAATLAAGSASADEIKHYANQAEFDRTYDLLSDGLQKIGIKPIRNCEPGEHPFCTNALVAPVKTGSVLAIYDTRFDDGYAVREMCTSPDANSLDRLCWDSTGETAFQHRVGTDWKKGKVVYSGFVDK